MAGAIYALMGDVNPVDHFIARRERLGRRREQLHDGVATHLSMIRD
jgi:hypothetical protein